MAWPAPSHYLNQCWIIVNWTLRNKLQWNLNQNSNILIQENALESVVCETAAILSRPQWVKLQGSVTRRSWGVGNASRTWQVSSSLMAYCHWRPISVQCTKASKLQPTHHSSGENYTICHAWDLWKLSQSCKQLHLLCPPDLWNLPGTALLSGFQSSWEALKSIE